MCDDEIQAGSEPEPSLNGLWPWCLTPLLLLFLSSITDKHSFQSKHTLSVKHTYTHVHICIHAHIHAHTRTNRPRDKTCSTVAMHDSLSPVKNDGWTGCVGRVNCLIYGEGQQIPMLLWHSEISWWSSGFWELHVSKRLGLRKRDLVLKVWLS